MGRKLRGQNTSLNVVSATDGVRDEFSDIRNMTVTFQRDVISEGYINQTTEQKDADFKGVAFKFEAHSRKKKIVDIVDRINRITRGLSNDAINIVTTLRFPDGPKRVIIPNAEFGDLEIGVGGKAEYVTFPFQGEADDYQIISV